MTLEEFRARRGEQKRRAMLDAARALFLADGFDRVSIERIAAEAGVSTATVYGHFEGKAGLFGAVVREAAGAMALDGERSLHETARAYARLIADTPVRDLMRLIIAEAPRFPELGEALFEHGKARVYAAFEAAFAIEAKAGRMAMPADPPLAASQISGMITQSVLMPWLIAGRAGVRDPEAVADAAVAAFLSGAGARG